MVIAVQNRLVDIDMHVAKVCGPLPKSVGAPRRRVGPKKRLQQLIASTSHELTWSQRVVSCSVCLQSECRSRASRFLARGPCPGPAARH
eukprot:10716953-Alexandrium_andersonii.AAC.1